MVFKVGASGGLTYKPEQWVSGQQIPSCLEVERKKKNYSPQLSVHLFEDELRSEDSIFILIWELHAFVCLHFVEKNVLYISDNDNTFIGVETIDKSIKSFFGALTTLDVRGVAFNQPFGRDNCGSAAVAIAMEYLRLYSDLAEIWSPTSIRTRVLKRLNQDQASKPASEIVKGAPSRPFFRCQCGRAFQSTNRKKLQLHQRHCRQIDYV